MNQEKIDVGCGVIFKDQKILIAQRPPNSHLGGYWEFPGGKKEKGENLFECLVREIEEELGVIVNPFETLRVVEHVALERTLRLHFVSCRFLSGVPQKRERIYTHSKYHRNTHCYPKRRWLCASK